MAWVRGRTEGVTEVDRVWGTRPAFYDTYMELYSMVLEQGDAVVLELCRLRMAMLMGSDVDRAMRYRPPVDAGLTEAKVRALSSWPTSPMFTKRERACIA